MFGDKDKFIIFLVWLVKVVVCWFVLMFYRVLKIEWKLYVRFKRIIEMFDEF